MKLWKLSLVLCEGALSLAIATFAGGTSDVRTGTVVATLNDTLIVRAADERSPHTERVSPQSTITRDGRTARLVDLRAGDWLTTTAGDDGCVTIIEATSSQRPEQIVSATGSPRTSN